MTQVREFITRWRAARRRPGYIPTQRELARARNRRLAAIAARRTPEPTGRHAAGTVAAPPVGHVSKHATDEGLRFWLGDGQRASALLRALRAQRRTGPRRARHGRHRPGRNRRPTFQHARGAARQSVPARDTARQVVAHLEHIGDILWDREERTIRRHYAPHSWGFDGHREAVWA